MPTPAPRHDLPDRGGKTPAQLSGPAPEAPDRPNPFSGFALVMILLILGGGLLLVTRLSADSKLQDCVMSGRKNCAPIDLPGSGR